MPYLPHINRGGLFGTVLKHLVFGDYSKYQALMFAPFGCGIPLGIVHNHCGTIMLTLFALNHTLLFGFDLNDFGADLVVLGAISDKEVWYIDRIFTSQRIAIGDMDASLAHCSIASLLSQNCIKANSQPERYRGVDLPTYLAVFLG